MTSATETQLSCPNCNTAVEVAVEAGSRVECRHCAAALKVFLDEVGRPDLFVVKELAADVRVPCEECGADISHSERFCLRCGTEVSDLLTRRLREQTRSHKRQAEIDARRIERDREFDRVRVRCGCKVLIWLALIFALSGTFMGLAAGREAETRRQELSRYDRDEVVQMRNGEVYVVAELYKRIDRAVTMVYAIYYFLAALMVGIYLWSRRAALPAMITGFGVYLALEVLSISVDPENLHRGIVLKILFVSAFVKGIKAAMEQRTAMLRAGG